MTVEPERLAQIHSNTLFVIEKLGELADFDLGLDIESVRWVEGFIERQRERVEGSPGGGIVSVLGSFLGEAILSAAGGEWHDHPQGGLGIRFANGDTCFPFAKVRKQFESGLDGGESIASFYSTAVDCVAKGKLRSGERLDP